jgi:hypothetical protein
MNDATVQTSEGRDEQTGQFLKGYRGGPGRAPGSRNKLTTEFLNDLRETWAEHGKKALEACARDKPADFCRIVAGLLPAKAELDVSLDMFSGANSVLECFRMMSAAVGGDSERVVRSLRKHAPHLLIEHDDA